MSKVSWLVFRNGHPRAHLVAASVPAARMIGSPDLKSAQFVLERLIKTLPPAGDYATTIVRQAGRPEVYLAFENELDAQKLAELVQAKQARRYPGWTSQRAFQLDAKTLQAMMSALPPRKSPLRTS